MVTAAAESGPQVSNQWPSSGYNSPTLTPELIASGFDPDGEGVSFDFRVFKSDGTKLADSGWIWTDDYVVPSGTLAWGQTYYWSVQVTDGDVYSDPPLFALQTQVPQALVYSGLAQDGGAPGNAPVSDGPGYDPQNGNFTTQATDVSVDVTGPELSIQRTYNSMDPRTAGRAFGTGWASVLDMQVRNGMSAADGSTSTEEVTYPDVERVAFGKNAGGTTYTPPQGRYGTLVPWSPGGFQLIDKNDTTYTFAQSLGSGIWDITSVTDPQGHALTFTYSAGRSRRSRRRPRRGRCT